MFNGTNLTFNSDVDYDTYLSVRMKDPEHIDASSPSTYKSRYKKEIKQRQGLKSTYNCIPEQQKSNNLNPSGPDQRHNIRPQLSHL